ncbi:MAG: hypothetical protein VKJ46_06115 [Leptolyngbyaceae bacterium]|nr:hypothetical protein [Leptolyngbyaceae bacterium]
MLLAVTIYASGRSLPSVLSEQILGNDRATSIYRSDRSDDPLRLLAQSRILGMGPK